MSGRQIRLASLSLMAARCYSIHHGSIEIRSHGREGPARSLRSTAATDCHPTFLIEPLLQSRLILVPSGATRGSAAREAPHRLSQTIEQEIDASSYSYPRAQFAKSLISVLQLYIEASSAKNSLEIRDRRDPCLHGSD